jgi:hypothetical protein
MEHSGFRYQLMAIAFGSAALVAALAWAQPAQAGPHGSQHGGGQPGAHAGQRDSGSSRQLQLRAPVAAPAQPFGYPGAPVGWTRRVTAVPPPVALYPNGQAYPVPAGAQLSRDADPHQVSGRALRAEATPPAQPFGYPSARAGSIIITGPVPTQSFAGSGGEIADR